MTALLVLALLACSAAVLYGGLSASSWLAASGLVGLLFALGLATLPVWRRVRSASDDLAIADGPRSDPPLLDVEDVDFDWPRRDAA